MARTQIGNETFVDVGRAMIRGNSDVARPDENFAIILSVIPVRRYTVSAMHSETLPESNEGGPDKRQVSDAAQELANALVPDRLLQGGENIGLQAERERIALIMVKAFSELMRIDAIDIKRITDKQAGKL